MSDSTESPGYPFGAPGAGRLRRCVGLPITSSDVEAAAPVAQLSRLGSLRASFRSMTSWPPRRWLAAASVAIMAALAIGVPTGIVETSFYTRMTPVTWWDYPVWALSAAMIGLIAATYVRLPSGVASAVPDRAKQTVGAGVLSVFAVGCPICNKLVVSLIGISGALKYFEPIQPLLGVAALAALAAGLAVRLRAAAVCPTPAH